MDTLELLRLALPPLLAASLLGCGDGSGAGLPAAPPAGFSPVVDHAYFPIETGVVTVYEGSHEGQDRREVVRAVQRARVIEGVSCSALLQDVFLDGELAEITSEWFAQDGEGNVWKFGEESYTVVDGIPILDADSWVAGEAGGEAWIAFPAQPRVGEVFYGYTPTGPDEFHVVSLSAVANVPAGIYRDCLMLLENPEDPEDADIILYGGGIGRLSEQNAAGLTDLVAVHRE